MKIRRIHFRGFGCWVNETFQFQDGINLIEAKNESGKSTLLQGIYALFFGARKEGLRVKKEAHWYEKYQPWLGSHYGGEVDYLLQDKEYRIYRNLSIDQQEELLIARKTGQDLTPFCPVDQKKDRLLLEQQIGLTGELYRRIAFLNSAINSPFKKREEEEVHKRVVDKMTQLLKQGVETDLFPVIDRLDKLLHEIGKTEHAKNKPYGIELEQEKRLFQEIQQLRDKRDQIQEEEKKLAQLVQQREKIQLDWEKIKEKYDAYRAEKKQQIELQMDRMKLDRLRSDQRRITERLQEEEELVQQIQQCEEEQSSYTPTYRIYAEQFQEIQLLHKRLEEIRVHLNFLQQEIDQAASQKMELEKEARWLNHFEEGELSQYLGRLREYDRISSMIHSLSEEAEIPNTSLDQIEADLNELERVIKKQQDLQEKNSLIQTEWLQFHEKSSNTSLPRFVHWLWISVLFGMIGIGCIIWQLPYAAALCWTLLLCCLIPFNQQRKQWNRKKRVWNRTFSNLTSQIEELQRENEQYTEQKRMIFRKWKVNTPNELYDIRDELREHSKIGRQKQQEMERLSRVLKEMKQGLESELSSFDSELGTFQFDTYQQKITQWKQEWEAEKKEISQFTLTFLTIDKESQRSREELEKCEQQLALWEKRLGTINLNQIKTWYKQTEQLEKIEWRIKQAQERLQLIQEKKEKEQWNHRLQQLSDRQKEIINHWQGSQSPMNQQMLGDDRIEQEKEILEKEIQQMDVEIGRWEKSIENGQPTLDRLRKLESEWEMTKRRISDLEQEKQVIEMARTVLLESVQEFQENLAPQLAPYATHWIDTMTHHRYQELSIDPAHALSLSVYVPETGKREPVENLSTGTIEQMYFALRMALLEFYSSSTSIPIPLILDDCFVHFDDRRLRAVLQLLSQLSKTHQIILCTCQDRERKILEEEQIAFHSLQLPINMRKEA